MRINKGGWILDVDHRLPKKNPTAAQLRKWAAEEKAWNKKVRAAAAFQKKIERDAAAAGLEFSGVEYEDFVSPAGADPEGPAPIEVVKTRLDAVVDEYRRTGSEKALIRASKMGCEIVAFFAGGSGMSYPATGDEFLRDGPKPPPGINPRIG